MKVHSIKEDKSKVYKNESHLFPTNETNAVAMVKCFVWRNRYLHDQYW